MPTTSDFDNPRNVYFVMRHGRSEANEQEIIISNPENGVPRYGLTKEGKLEVQKSAGDAKASNILDETVVIVSSDFARTKETAEIMAEVLGVSNITLTSQLRERFFGEFETTHNSNYEKVWEADSVDHTHRKQGVESVADVLERSTSLIRELEDKYTGRRILLVSHGDTLQILQTVFEKVHPSQHRSLASLKTAEIRKIN